MIRPEWRELDEEIEAALGETFGEVRATVRKNLAALLIGLVVVLRMSRGWYGRLTLSGIGRAMPTVGSVKVRYKRLHRFLDNPHFRTDDLGPGLVRAAVGANPPSLLPVLIDQTTVGDVQVLTGSYPVDGRSIPLAMTAFEYGKLGSSQTLVEEEFLRRTAASVPRETRLIWIMDRGYGRVALVLLCHHEDWLFVIRSRSDILVETRGRRLSLSRLPHRQGVACRYRNVLYHGQKKVRVDLIIFRERGFRDPWFLLVPPDSEERLSTDAVVRLYRSRMRIETSFRDFKSWLGVRGLRLKVRKAERLNRLLMGLSLGYVLLLALGTGQLGQQLRREMEILRRTARHGTRRTLSDLFLALLVLSDVWLFSPANLKTLIGECLLAIRSGPVVPAALLI
jgi:hypothetical protein